MRREKAMGEMEVLKAKAQCVQDEINALTAAAIAAREAYESINEQLKSAIDKRGEICEEMLKLA